MELRNLLPSSAIRLGSPSNSTAIFVPDMVGAIRDRYNFVEYPTTVAAHNPDSGMTFLLGRLEGTVIDKLQIYRTGLLVEASVRTDALDGVLDSVESLLISQFATTLTPTPPVTRIYGSKVEVKMRTGFSEAFEKFDAVRGLYASMISELGFDAPHSQVTGFSISADVVKSQQDLKPARFVLERRAGQSFDEDIFFSEAPLSTARHLELLTAVELLF